MVAGAVYFLFDRYGCTLDKEPSAFAWMIGYWFNPAVFNDATYWQGPLIPISALGIMAWRFRTFIRLPRRPSIWGLVLMAAALSLHWIGLRAQQPRISLLSLILLLGGLVWLELGQAWLKEIIFPLGLLVFCIPMNFLDALTFPMRVFSARLAATLISGFGAEMTTQGAVLINPATGAAYDGSDAASGIQMLLLVGWLSALIAYAVCRRFHTRWMAFTFFIPALLLANVVRLTVVGLIDALAGTRAALLVHESGSTWIVAGITLVMVAGGPIMAKQTVTRWRHAVARS